MVLMGNGELGFDSIEEPHPDVLAKCERYARHEGSQSRACTVYDVFATDQNDNG